MIKNDRNKGKRISNEKSKIILTQYQGKRISPESKELELKRKRTLRNLKYFLCASLILGLSSSDKIDIDSSYVPNIESSLHEDIILRPIIKQTVFKNLVDSINEEIMPRENIFIGDSRTQGMLQSGAISESNTIYGVGYGYNWFIGEGNFNSEKTNAIHGAVNKLRTIMEEDKKYNIIIWLGVNDLKYKPASLYFEEFLSLATGELSRHDLFIVSVGPVSQYKETSVSNNQINSFNEELKDLVLNSGVDNLKYIELNEFDLRIQRYDKSGIHYGYTDYRNIYDIIISSMEKTATLKIEK